jgi:hypothetical protein
MVLPPLPLLLLGLVLLHAPLRYSSAVARDHIPAADSCALAPPPPDGSSGLRVAVDRTLTLFSPALSLASAGEPFAFANGDVQAVVRYGANESHATRSSDGGRSWTALGQQPPPFSNRTVSEVRTYAHQGADGAVVLFSGFRSARRDGAKSGQDFVRGPDGAIATELLRSHDSGLTQTSSVAKLWLPPELQLENLQHAPIVQLANGSLLTVTYGNWLCSDKTPALGTSCHRNVTSCDAPWRTRPCADDADCATVSGRKITCGHQPPVCQRGTCYSTAYKVPLCVEAVQPAKGPDQVFAMLSHDRGDSWHYLNTVGATGNSSCAAGATAIGGGLNEAWLSAVPAANGSGTQQLVCFMRSRDGPLYRSISLDDTASSLAAAGGAARLAWSTPVVVVKRGVSPTGAFLSSIGVFALAFGRPGNWLALSTDGGDSFGTPWCYKGEESSYDGSDYDAVVALPSTKPGEQQLMLSYKTCTGPYACSAIVTIVNVSRPAASVLKTDDVGIPPRMSTADDAQADPSSARDVMVWCSVGDETHRAATEAYLTTHRKSISSVSPILYGVSDDGELSITPSAAGTKSSARDWAKQTLQAKLGLRVVPIIYADDSHNPIGLQKLRKLAANPTPFATSLVSEARHFGWSEYNIDLEECHMDARHLKDCKNQSTTDADSQLFMELMDFLGTALHREGIAMSVDVDSRVHRQPNPDRFFKYEMFNQSKADVWVQMDTYSCYFLGFMNGLMLARNQVNTSKLAFGLCPGCCGDDYDATELRLMFDSFALSGVNRLALWNVDDNQHGGGSGKAGWPPALLDYLARFLAGNEQDVEQRKA